MTELPDWAQHARPGPASRRAAGSGRRGAASDRRPVRTPARLRRARAALERPSCSCSCRASSRRGTPCAAPNCGCITAAARCCSRWAGRQGWARNSAEQVATTLLLGSDVDAGEQPAAAGPTGALATGPPARRRARPGELRRGARLRLRRLRAGRPYRLSSATAADTSAALSGAVEPSGSRSVSSMPMRVCTPTHPGVFQ